MKLQLDDGTVLNTIVNHPDVLSTFTDAQHLDMRPLAQDPHSIVLCGDPPEVGAFLFFCIVNGVGESHGAVLPEGRGPWAKDLAENCIYEMFTTTDCVEIMTRVPEGHVATSALVRGLGFKKRWERPEIKFRGKLVPFSVWSLVMQDWWPADYDTQKLILKDMHEEGPPGKAANWYSRWAHLSRTG